MSRVKGTLEYIAPEKFEKQDFTNKVDVWAAGCVLYELMNFEKLFQATSENKLFNIKQKIEATIPKLFDDKYPELEKIFSR